MNKLRTRNVLLLCSIALGLSIMVFPQTVAAKSVYLSANHHTRQFDAWSLNPDGTVTYQATYNLAHSTDPAGIGIDAVPDNPGDPIIMFITSEFSGGVEIVDPVSLTYMGVSSGPRNLGGVDVDDVDNIVFTLGRQTNRLYIYDWNPGAATLTQSAVITLPGLSYGFGLAFDDTRDVLWVSDTGNWMVRAYDLDVSTWSAISEIPSLSFHVSHRPVDVAVDAQRNIVYTVGSWYGSRLLSKYDVGTGVETTIDLGIGGIGVAVDEVTGYVYMTRGTSSSGDDVQVWDCSTSPFTLIQDTPRIGNPAGIAIANVSYNPLRLAKNDVIVGSVHIGDNFTYELTYENVNPYDVTNVAILDTLPVELDFVSATHGGVYDPVGHTVLWDIGTVAAGEAGPTIELVVTVNQNAVPGSTIYNYATITADEVPPTTVIDDEGSDDPGDEPGTPVCQVVDIDIYPNRVPNRVYLSRNYTIYVAVKGSAEFDVTTLDTLSVLFGPTGTEAAPVRGPMLRDFIRPLDGFLDAMYGFRTFDCGFQLGDTQGLLTGLSSGGIPIEGTDSVVVYP